MLMTDISEKLKISLYQGRMFMLRSHFYPIQDVGEQEGPLCQFFPYNYHKRRNLSPKHFGY